MFEYRKNGYAIDILLPDLPGHIGYYVDCRYKFVKSQGKYRVSMWLKNKKDRAEYKISGVNTDTQYITSSKETINEDIVDIVEQAFNAGFFDDYIEAYEYTMQCYYVGDEYFRSQSDQEEPVDGTEN